MDITLKISHFLITPMLLILIFWKRNFKSVLIMEEILSRWKTRYFFLDWLEQTKLICFSQRARGCFVGIFNQGEVVVLISINQLLNPNFTFLEWNNTLLSQMTGSESRWEITWCECYFDRLNFFPRNIKVVSLRFLLSLSNYISITFLILLNF